MKKNFGIGALTLLVAFSTLGEMESEPNQLLSSTVSSGLNLDIDGNGDLTLLPMDCWSFEVCLVCMAVH